MLDDTSAKIYAAIGSRDWWGVWSDRASVAVALGVILEGIAEVKALSRWFGLSTRESLRVAFERIGLAILVVALLAEVGINRHIADATNTIEIILGDGLNTAVAANSVLETRLKSQQTGLTSAQTQISALSTQEATIRSALDKDAAALRKQSEYLAGRHLTKRQYEAIQTLKGKFPAILLITEAHCTECLNFVSQLAVAFTNADIKVGLSMPETFIGTSPGFCVYTSPNGAAVIAALQKAGFIARDCGSVALPVFGIQNPDRPIVGVGQQSWFTTPAKAYLGPTKKPDGERAQ